MKLFARFSFIVLICFTIISCNSDDAIDTSNIIGKWKLAQVLADPGDGSGTFVDVESDKTITFLSDETFSSNGNLCLFFSNLPTDNSEGTFSVEDKKIYPFLCEPFNQVVLNYTLENGSLIINYQCIEACAEKYVKIE